MRKIKNVEDLLRTREWRGSKVTGPFEHEFAGHRPICQGRIQVAARRGYTALAYKVEHPKGAIAWVRVPQEN